MTTHSWITDVEIRERTVPGKRPATAPRTDSLGQTAHGILIAALLLGSFGLGAATTPEYGTIHPRVHHYSGHIRHKTKTDLMGTGHIIDTPWLY